MSSFESTVGHQFAERASLVIQRAPEERENLVRFQVSAPIQRVSEPASRRAHNAKRQFNSATRYHFAVHSSGERRALIERGERPD